MNSGYFKELAIVTRLYSVVVFTAFQSLAFGIYTITLKWYHYFSLILGVLGMFFTSLIAGHIARMKKLEEERKK